jgi:hypothetical protein
LTGFDGSGLDSLRDLALIVLPGSGLDCLKDLALTGLPGSGCDCLICAIFVKFNPAAGRGGGAAGLCS